MDGNQTSLIESIDSDIKKCCSGKYKIVTKVCCLWSEESCDRDWFLSQSISVQFPAKTLKSSMQQISLVLILQKVLQIRHSLTPFSSSERESVKTNARWYPVLFSSTTTTTSRLKYFISSEKATKISPPSSAADFTHSVFHGCNFRDWNTLHSSPVFEQSVGIYEPKAPSFRVFWSKGRYEN